jgi:hypothetical protein
MRTAHEQPVCAGRRITFGQQPGMAASRTGQGALITATPKGPCDPEVITVYLLAVKYPGHNGCYVIEVRVDQNVPNPVPEEHLAKIIGSFRII